MKQVVYHTDNQWFISNGIQLQEVDFAYILQWQEEGMLIMLESGELYD
jgi:hypothetical protein